MPIIKDAKVGKTKEVTIVQFGFGDVLVSSGHDSEKKEIKMLAFSEHKPLYADQTLQQAEDTNELENLVLIHLTGIESVDAIMNHLKAIKKQLIKEKNERFSPKHLKKI